MMAQAVIVDLMAEGLAWRAQFPSTSKANLKLSKK
jgi:hypothetical protein